MQLTYKEGMRQRILIGIVFTAIIVILFSTFISGLFMRDILITILDICISSVSLGGLMIPFFLTVSLFSGDLEKKTIYTVLSRPVKRSHYIIGKFFGLTLICATVMLILTAGCMLAVFLSKFLYHSLHFTSFRVEAVFLAALMSFLGITILNSCVIFWCSITTSSFLASMLALATYIVGQSTEDIVRFISSRFDNVEISPVIEATTNILLYLFPYLSAFDYKQHAVHALLPAANEIIILIVYTGIYCSIMLLLASAIFNRRDLT